jgi:receptor protein-tyrosine kinase
MSRIDKALRRSAIAPALPENTQNNDVFTSVWRFEQEAPQPLPDVEPTSTSAFPELPPTVSGASASLLMHTPVQQAPVWSPESIHIALSPSAEPHLVEQFRRVAANLYHAQLAHGIKIVMMSSAAPGDGKTLSAINLASVLSDSYGRKVLLIDADLRRPSITRLARIGPMAGLSEGLRAPEDQKLPLVQLTENLTVLPAGRPDPDPMSGLTSERMRRILSEAATKYDWVILDAPPVAPVADAGVLASMADAVLLVIRAGVTPFKPVQRAVEALGRERIFGVILNGATPSESGYDADYYAQYHDPGAKA